MNIEQILATQDGVIARRQVLEAGESDTDIRRRLRRREWRAVHPGVYVDHTGPLTWSQRAWAAVLFHDPAYLDGTSALHAFKVRGHEPGGESPIHVCVDRTRTVQRRVGIVVHQVARVASLGNDTLSPPRLTLEHALLSAASRRRRLDASVALLADAVQDGRTTAGRLLTALAERPRLRHRKLLRVVLSDVHDGVRSVLEHRYLRSVERAHGLPRGVRQGPRTFDGKLGYPDVSYEEQRVLVHLDGRVGHTDSLDRWADLERDLAGLIEGEVSVHAGWRQVLDPCRLAWAIARLLQSRGWTGSPIPCGPLCTGIPSPAASFPARSS